jgi:hypothetical protein
MEELVPRRLRTRPVITLSGRSIVLATATTMSLLLASVGQLKKLYITSCFGVTSWSSSSIKTTLDCYELHALLGRTDKLTTSAGQGPELVGQNGG